ncbi:deoxyribonuclease-1-like isoform X2 [Cololabis saira]|uniref:deoxyribonuclease-1-like isoform X2 n=1 Tax=Cololabis saira TaxID=129043 RepID=UPI002AD3C9B0|nr:deoxyribonuclease-1-like isoform X2 [Cololabis saira]
MKDFSSRRSVLLLFCVFSLSVWTPAASEFRICSYNVQNFNLDKASNYRVLHTLTRIVSRCDICLLQHVVDPDGKAIGALLAALNRYNGHRYKSVTSTSLGNSPDDMEQYVFIFRPQQVKVTGEHQYKGKLSFDRPPFVIRFQSTKTAINEFILVPLHSNPKKAVQEIDQLYNVFEEVSRKWNNSNVMFLGDFHAGCAYVTRKDRKSIRLYKNSNFSWLIGDRADTTVTDSTTCPYDRIVVHGEPFLKAIVPFSSQVFKFGEDFKLEKRKVLEVSDHYPLEVTLKSSAPLLQATPLLILLTVIVRFFMPTL